MVFEFLGKMLLVLDRSQNGLDIVRALSIDGIVDAEAREDFIRTAPNSGDALPQRIGI